MRLSKSETRDLLILGLCAAAVGIAGGMAEQAKRDKEAARKNRSRNRAQGALNGAAMVLGVKPPPLVELPGSRGAFSNGREILVDLDWLDLHATRCLGDLVCVDSWRIGIMAHELGHHLRRDSEIYRLLTPWENHYIELRADACAGFVLGQLGIDAEHFALLIASFSRLATWTHPAGIDRFDVITRCYRHGLRSRLRRVA